MKRESRRGIYMWFGKVLAAGVISIAVLTVFCMFYESMPPAVSPEDGVTDMKYIPNTFWCHGREGFGTGRTNNDGYLNLFDYEAGESVDVLVMGPSHMEAFQVPMRDSTASRLNAMMDGTVYNIGISGNYFLSCARNLDAALRKYEPAKYVIIDTHFIRFGDDNLTAVLQGTYPERIVPGGKLHDLLRKEPFIHLAVVQVRELLGLDEEALEENGQEGPDNPALVGELLTRMAGAVTAHGAKLIIAYHPGTALKRDGSVQITSDKAEEDAFARLCEDNGILFLNMRGRFLSEYRKEHVLPYGFANTSVGAGHLNKEGHRMLAEELYRLMREAEG